MDFPGVEFTVMYAVLSVVSLIAAIFEKNYKYLCFILGLISLLGTIMSVVNLQLQSEKLFMLSSAVPIGLLLVALGVNTTVQYNKCTVTVTAECIGGHSAGYKGRRSRFPRFRYWYKGKTYEGVSVVCCSPEQFQALLQNKRRTIYINPQKPTRCVAKIQFPLVPSVGVIVLGGLFLLFAAYIFVFAA